MALQENRIGNRITIIGAGTTGYLSTFFLVKNYPNIHFTWIYPENNKPVGVGEATVPAVTDFLKKLGITPEIILNDLNGSLKLGIEFKDFYKINESFYHPFGNTDNEAQEIQEMMKNNSVPDNILEYSDIATHFDVVELMNYLDSKMNFDNLTIIRKEITDLSEIQDNLIIDCTGFKKSLNNKTFKTITDKIPNDCAYIYRDVYNDIDNQKKPFTVAQATDSGWIWNISLKNKLSIGYVHSSNNDVLEEFKNYIKEKFGSINEENIFKIDMLTGRNEEHIVEKDKTIITLGLSSFFIEPLESTGLYLVVYGIQLLDEYLKNKITAQQYNEIYNNEFDVILDFIVAHYKYSTRNNKYWEQYKNIEIEKFKENNIFPTRSWNYILEGMNQQEKQKINSLILLKVRKYKKYLDWIKDEKNIK